MNTYRTMVNGKPHTWSKKKCRPCRRRLLTIQMFSTCNIPVSFQTMATSRLCNQLACHPDASANVDVFVIEITEHRRVPPEPYGHVLREYPEQW